MRTFFVPNDHIFHYLNIPQNSPNLEYTSYLPKNVIIYCRPQFPPLGGAIIKESAFWFITHILCRTFKNLICTRSLNCAESCDIGPFHKFAKCRKPTFSNSSQLFSQISTKLCTQHLHYLDSPDKNLLKNVDIPNNTQVVELNFLYILLKTHSVGYLHIGLSEWHETQVTTSPWATKALWKNDKLTFSNSS